MEHKNSEKLFNYWNRLRGTRLAPDRREIEPSDIRELLSDTFILEVDPIYKSLSFRLAGTRFCSAFGRELKGLGFLAIWDETDNFPIMRAAKQVRESLQPCRITCTARSLRGRFAEYEILLLPLQHANSEFHRIVGIASSVASEPWIGSDALVSMQVTNMHKIDITAVPDAPSVFGFPTGIACKPESTQKQFSHLTVIDGGRHD